MPWFKHTKGVGLSERIDNNTETVSLSILTQPLPFGNPPLSFLVLIIKCFLRFTIIVVHFYVISRKVLFRLPLF